MTIDPTSALTSKQRKVYDAISAGTPPAEIARQLKISPSGVYGHMRNIRKTGVALPGYDGQLETPSQAPAATNGAAPDPLASLAAAIDHMQAERDANGAEVARLEERVQELVAQRTTLDERIEKYSAALGALS
jgi:flagellin-like hook-associated protein FlgL